MYYLAFIYLFGLVLLEDKLKDRNKIILALIPLILIVVLRYGIGADYFSYERIYYSFDDPDFFGALAQNNRIEVLFRLLNVVAIKLGLSYHVFVTIISGFLTYLTLKWIKNNSPNFYLSVLLHFSMLFIYWNLSALRQGIVLTLLLYIYFNGKKEYSPTIKAVSALVLVFVHPTAVIVPIVYLISLIPWNKKIFLLLLVISPLSRFIFSIEFLKFFSWLPYMKKVIHYMSYNSIQLLSVPSLLRFSFFIFILWHYDKLNEKYPDKKLMFNFALVSLLLYFYLPVSMVIGTRATIFGYYLTIIIFPMILTLYSKEKLYPVILAGFLVMSTASFYNEFSKVAARSGYSESMHKLNFVTILEKDRKLFGNNYAFHLHVDEENKKWAENSDISKRVNSEFIFNEAEYEKDEEYLSVYFPANNRYGIINTKGQVVVVPEFGSSQPIFGSFIQFESGASSFSQKTYRDIKQLYLPYLGFDYVQDVVTNHLEAEQALLSNRLFIEELHPTWVDSVEFLDNYNTNPIVVVERYSYPDVNDFSYIRLRTTYRDYYLIFKGDELFVEKIYKSVNPISVKNIIVAKTEYTTDYINEDGEIIWFEYIN